MYKMTYFYGEGTLDAGVGIVGGTNLPSQVGSISAQRNVILCAGSLFLTFVLNRHLALLFHSVELEQIVLAPKTSLAGRDAYSSASRKVE